MIQLLPGIRIKVPDRHSTHGRVKVKSIQLFLGKDTVYATKDNYQDSEAATATLCWIDVAPQTEGIIDEDAIAELKAMPVLIQSQGSTITIQGAAEGAPIAIYDIEGKQYGTSIVEKDYTTISTSLRPGSVAVVKIGEKSVKVKL